MTSEQYYFWIGLTELDAYSFMLEDDTLDSKTQRNAAERIQDIQFSLWLRIENYAKSIANAYIQRGGGLPSDAFDDMLQECAAMFFRKLGDYIPEKYTPTTFFKPYFTEVISKYVVDSVHLSKHEMKIYRTLSNAYEAFYKEYHKIPDSLEISRITNLSSKICRRYPELQNRRYFWSIHPIETKVIDHDAFLEKNFLHQELMDSLHFVFSKCLTEKERMVFFVRVNAYGKTRSFGAVAETLGIYPREAKALYYSAISKIRTIIQ